MFDLISPEDANYITEMCRGVFFKFKGIKCVKCPFVQVFTVSAL